MCSTKAKEAWSTSLGLFSTKIAQKTELENEKVYFFEFLFKNTLVEVRLSIL
jgi:hypothetical protein